MQQGQNPINHELFLENPPNEILFACTGVIGESYPTEKIKKQIQKNLMKFGQVGTLIILIKNIKSI